MEKKQRPIIFIIAGGLIILIACVAGYFIWQRQTTESVRLEGQKYADEYLSKYIIRCGDATYISAESNMLDSKGSLMPVRRLIQTEWVKAIFAPSKEPLTSNEQKENITAKGKVQIVNSKNREYDFIRQRWDGWNDSDYRVDTVLGTSLYRTNAGWSSLSTSNLGRDFLSTGNYGAVPKTMACSDIPK